jgi:cytochrome c oxidase subunit III
MDELGLVQALSAGSSGAKEKSRVSFKTFWLTNIESLLKADYLLNAMSSSQDTASHHHTPSKVKRDLDMFGRASNGKIGMWFFLITDALTFSGLLLGYGILRARTPDWPSPSEFLGIPLAAFMTFLLICSSVTMVIAQAAGEDKQIQKMLKYLLFTALGGAIFLGIQVYEYWHLVTAMGMTFSEFLHGPPQFSSAFYIITGFHGFHVLCGVIYLLVIAGQTAAGKFDDGNTNLVEICGLFWHFVDLVWILVFTFLYLV